MTEPDVTMTKIGRGMELSQGGEREASRVVFTEVWEQIGGEDGDPFHRCAVAPSMANVQDEAREELLWDQRALPAAGLITDERAAQWG